MLVRGRCQSCINGIAVVLLVVTGCSQARVTVPTRALDPSRLPVTANDLREANIKEKSVWKVVIVTPRYASEDYEACAAEVQRVFADNLRGVSSIVLADPSDFLRDQELKKFNTLFHDEPHLVNLANQRGIDGLIMAEVQELALQSKGATIRDSDVPTSKQRYARNASIRLRIKVLDTFGMNAMLTKDVKGQARVGTVALDATSEVLSAAAIDAVLQVKDEIARKFTPMPYVTEVRGDGKYVKINIGRAGGVSNGIFLDIYRFIAIKDESGTVISKETRRVASVRVIAVGIDHCWCDASLSQGMILIGHVAVPSPQ